MLLTLLSNRQAPLQPNTPKQRQQVRVGLKQESPTPYPSMAPNGSSFVLQVSAPIRGSVVFGNLKWTYDIHESYLDGGVITWDVRLAQPLRDLGIYNETVL